MVLQRGADRGAERSRAEEAVALLQREEISPHRLPQLSPQLVAPPPPLFFFLHHRDARITFPRRCMRACVCVFSQGLEEGKKTSLDYLPGVFLCPVTTASPVTGCNQVVLLASSLLVEENGGKGEQRTRKKTNRKNASEK